MCLGSGQGGQGVSKMCLLSDPSFCHFFDQLQHYGASIKYVRKNLGFFYLFPPPLYERAADLDYKIHATSLLRTLFPNPLPPPTLMCTYSMGAPPH